MPANDRGAVADQFPMGHMILQLRRSPAQENALKAFIDQLHDPKSPNFHKWLTAQEFGEKYGLAQEDLNTIQGWLNRTALKSAGFMQTALSLTSPGRRDKYGMPSRRRFIIWT